MHRGFAAVSGSERIVICCLGDEAFRRVSGVLIKQAFSVVRIGPDRARAATHERDVVGLVFDPEVPDARTVVDILHHWRNIYPSRPVLLYHRPTEVSAQVVASLAHLSGVIAWSQARDSADERHHLAAVTHGLFSETPALVIRALIAAVRPAPPAGVSGFLRALLDHLQQGRRGAPEVRELAARARLKPWVVRRACKAAELPTPERLVEWFALIYVIALADWERVSIASAAARVGLSDKYVRRLRASLLPDIHRLRGSGARDALAYAVAQFAKRCGVPSDQATSLAERFTA